MRNLTLFQFFHWYYDANGNLWQHAKNEAAHLRSLGVTHIWLPPAYKSAIGQSDPGYAVYDLYDLGEFDQKGTVRTRHGTKQEYHDAIDELHKNDIKVIADVVFNHMMGADEQEDVHVRYVDDHDRTSFTSEVEHARLNTKFLFPGRNGQYSNFIWDWHCFSGVCEHQRIAMIQNEYTNGTWENILDDQFGNYDYLMGCDIEFRNPAVRQELKNWGTWYTETTYVDGFRLDALKHIVPDFFPEWIDHVSQHTQKPLLFIGEYWKNNLYNLLNYIEATQGKIQLFDVPLHFNFYDASQKGGEYDLRTIFDNSLVSERPELAITFVDNHDTQPLQSLQSTVEFWFKPIAYALILLREQAIPCVFYPALYEAKYFDVNTEQEQVYVELNKVPHLDTLLKLRAAIAYGPQHDYFDHPNCIGWVREGNPEHPQTGMAVLISNTEAAGKYMHMGERHAGKTFYDALGNREEKVTLNEKGEGEFFVNGRSLSVWVPG